MSKYFTTKEYLKDREKLSPLTPDMVISMEDLLRRMDKIRAAWGKSMTVSSGYRPEAVNASIGGAKKSNHMICKAVDIADPKGELGAWCLKNLKLLEEAGLYIENPAKTTTWVHFQSVPPKSGKRVFDP